MALSLFPQWCDKGGEETRYYRVVQPSLHRWPVSLQEVAEGPQHSTVRPQALYQFNLPTSTLSVRAALCVQLRPFHLVLTLASCLPTPEVSSRPAARGGVRPMWLNELWEENSVSRRQAEKGIPDLPYCAWPEFCLPGCPEPSPEWCQYVSASASPGTNYGCDVSSPAPGACQPNLLADIRCLSP